MSYQREYPKKLRVGLVGVGGHAYRNILPALHFLPVELVALCDVNQPLLEKTAKEYRIEAIFTDSAQMYREAKLDAAFLCVGPKLHCPLATQALQAGLHVWMEKPPAMRAAEIENVIAARKDRICGVGFKKAWMPATRKAKELLALPEFGKLRSILAIYPMAISTDGRGVLERGEFTDWLGNGCHPLSAMIELGGRVQSVTTLLGPGAQAVGSVNLQFVSGAVGVLHLAGGSARGVSIERYMLFGNGYTISIEDAERVVYHRGIPFNYGMQRTFAPPGTDHGAIVWQAGHFLATLENKALFVQGIFDELYDFCMAALESRSLATCDLEFALHVMQAYEAALLSNGNPVVIGSQP